MVSSAIKQLYDFVVAVIQLREDITSCYYYTKATVLFSALLSLACGLYIRFGTSNEELELTALSSPANIFISTGICVLLASLVNRILYKSQVAFIIWNILYFCAGIIGESLSAVRALQNTSLEQNAKHSHNTRWFLNLIIFTGFSLTFIQIFALAASMTWVILNVERKKN
ncbi:uncharacterized protein LOC134715227 [Mytilus trossulus]|uniref:uncharacterized protein LOC134715227 n=1 Tax=Mytilus trossulus TaxID=6551 RepID=UPI0030041889